MDANAEKNARIILPTYDAMQSMVSTKLDLGMTLDEEDFKVIFRDASKYHEKNSKEKTVKFIGIKYGKLDPEVIDKLLESLED